MTNISELIDRLTQYGVTICLAGDKIRVRRPDPVPAELDPLLAELKARRDEVVAYLRGQEEGGTQPHPGDLAKPFFRDAGQPAGVPEDSLLRGADTGERLAPAYGPLPGAGPRCGRGGAGRVGIGAA